ncbi:MAG: hypothetical protein J6S57_03145 [Alphaproteobacteria bacterium]|nr:hypothetical protein [Alphaproteobacteria bacterium]
MHKLVFLPVFLALFVVDFDALAARGDSSRPYTPKEKIVRPAVPPQSELQTVSSSNSSNSSVTSARAASVRGVIKNTATTSQNNATVSAGGNVAARAGAKQKVINMGTKVSAATENTVVSEECQTAYYGCMDAFCVLDNASGGRCQCSDRHTELDAVLEEIMKLDEQSLLMATEGVERLQMGENADEVMGRVKKVTDSITEKKSSSNGGKTVRTLDLSAWKRNSVFDTDDDVFDENSIFTDSESTFAGKTGDELQGAASRLCVQQLPAQCKNSASFLQLTYAQKIKSDCTAYENSLRQQRSASAEKLQTAQKALRETALEMYQNENKYDLGQCVTRFKQCMQTTAECGDDFSGCIADTAILGQLYKKSNAKNSVATTVIKTGSTAITISSASYDILTSKKALCESVTKQCVNANKKGEVWQQVMKDLAPVIYTAEYNAASNSRMNCINTAVTCVKTVCGSRWDENDDNYDACLSDPDIPASSCKLELNKCGGIVSGDDRLLQDKVWDYVKAKLAAIKVDKCTLEIKQCLTSEDNCGEDYANCVGLDTDSIVDMCYEDKLIACSTKFNSDTVRDYIAKVAQGLALNIENNFATVCQNAVDAAFSRVCGEEIDEDYEEVGYCKALKVDKDLFTDSMSWQYCKDNDCNDVLSYFSNDDIKSFAVKPEIVGRLTYIDKIDFDEKGKCGNASGGNVYFCVPGESDATIGDVVVNILASMNRDYVSVRGQIASDNTVKNCVEGRTVRGISKTNTRGTRNQKASRNPDDETEVIGGVGGRFPALLDNVDSTVGSQILDLVRSDYYAEITRLRESGKAEEMREEISKRHQQIILDDLTRRLMNGADFCSLSPEEFSTLMANSDVQSTLDKEQDDANREKCEITCKLLADGTGSANPDYCEKPNFCSKPSGRRCFDDDGNRIDNAGAQTQRKTPSYDPATNTCNVTVETFECKQTGSSRAHRNKCKRWDTAKPNSVEVKSYPMPKWNDKGSEYIKSGCTSGSSGGSSGGSGGGNSGTGGGLFGYGPTGK